MNIFWIIGVIILSLIILYGLFLLFVISKMPQAFNNKFGPEWIPNELNIRFNHFNVNFENNKIIKYLLSEDEIYEISIQINYLISNQITYNITNSDTLINQKYSWRRSDNETYEYRQVVNDELKASLLLNTNELVYFK